MHDSLNGPRPARHSSPGRGFAPLCREAAQHGLLGGPDPTHDASEPRTAARRFQTDMAGNLKGGIIGCGFFAERHIEAWRRIRDVEIVAAADPRLDRAGRFADRVYSTAEELLDRERLDFVDIVTRAETHLP